MEQSSQAVEGPLDATVGLQRAAPPDKPGLTGAKMLRDMKRRPPHQQPEWLRRDAADSPAGLLFLPPGVKWAAVDAELHAVSARYLEKAKLARATAKQHRQRGDLVRWRKANSVARVWEMAHDALWMVACPF